MNFWTEFMKIEQLVVHHLRLDTEKDQAQALHGIEIAGKRSGYPLLFQVGYNIRNGRKLPERKDSLELILSPNWNRNKISMVEEVYEAHKKANLPKYWNIVKYQVFNPSFVYDLKVQDITHESFQYCAQININGTSAWLGVLIFVEDELAKKILKKRKEDKETPEKNEWDLVSDGSIKSKAPLLFLNSTVGEYNMITRIKAVEFVPMSSHKTIPRYSLTDLHQEFEKMDKHEEYGKKVYKCNRCEYNSYQVDVSSCERCKKIYYCDDVCKKADSKNHSYVCHE